MSKQAVLGFPWCPLLPNSLWNDVLLDRYVDFDKILSGYYALKSDHRQTQSFGNLDISLNTGGSSGKSFKEIQIYGEWSIVYARYTRAVVFMYPHLQGNFVTSGVLGHSQVLLNCKGDHQSVVRSLISCCAKGGPRHWLQLICCAYLP